MGLFDKFRKLAAARGDLAALGIDPFGVEIESIISPTEGVIHGRRTILAGTNKIIMPATDANILPYLPLQTDIIDGDLLVSSGLGGVFPADYPVAKVTAVQRDSGSPLAVVRASTLAALDRDRVVGFLWFDPVQPVAEVPP